MVQIIFIFLTLLGKQQLQGKFKTLCASLAIRKKPKLFVCENIHRERISKRNPVCYQIMPFHKPRESRETGTFAFWVNFKFSFELRVNELRSSLCFGGASDDLLRWHLKLPKARHRTLATMNDDDWEKSAHENSNYSSNRFRRNYW